MRLNQAEQFRKVREEGNSRAGKYFRLSAWQTGSADESRLGMITSRKVGPAVARNRVRRWFREIHRLHQQEIDQGWWIIVLARKEAATAGLAELEREWLRLCRKLSILRIL